MGTGGAAVKVLDLDGQVRQSRLQDLFDIGRLVTALDNIHFYLRPVVALDIGDLAVSQRRRDAHRQSQIVGNLRCRGIHQSELGSPPGDEIGQHDCG
jgi:trimethylamine:corrinoid methyltransferase-like protein